MLYVNKNETYLKISCTLH